MSEPDELSQEGRRRSNVASLPWPLLLGLAGLLVSSGCSGLERFDTKPGEAYCGNIVPGPFVRHGFAPNVRVRLHLHTNDDANPGDVSSSDGLMNNAPLVEFPEISNDDLGKMTLGEGSARTLTYALTVGDRPGIAFITLLENGDVELRVVQGVPGKRATDGVPERNSYWFGLFPLSKQAGTCGF